MHVSVIARLAFASLILFSAGAAARADNAAHDLANRFSETGSNGPGPKDDAERAAYEAEMLNRARQEARERAQDEIRAEAEAELHRKSLEAQRDVEARTLADKLKRADEARKAKAADASEEKPFRPALTTIDKAAKPAPGTTVPIVVAPPAAPGKAVDLAEETPSPVTAVSGSPVAPEKAVETGRAAPSSVPPALTPPGVEQPTDFASEPPKVLPPPMALGRPAPPLPPVAAAPADPRVTILLVMEPGKKGIRRFNKTADPVICEYQTCFVSNGAGSPARVLELRKALGPGNTFGKRAGACRSKLTCVFRGVMLAGAAPTIQPVDLKVLVHDRREARTVSGDASCRVVAGRLSCGRTVVAQGYRAWIVPESVAEAAGPTALEAAVIRGLVANPLREASVTQ